MHGRKSENSSNNNDNIIYRYIGDGEPMWKNMTPDLTD